MHIKVLIIDLGSKFNLFGGQARLAATLNKRLNGGFTTFYMGYETSYSHGMKNPTFISRGGRIGVSARKSPISEMRIPRLAYNLLVVSRMADLDREKLVKRAMEIKPDIVIANSIQDINLIRLFKRSGMDFKSVYIDHGSVSTSIAGYMSKEGIPLTFGTGLDSISLSRKKSKFFNFYDANVALNQGQLSAMCNFTDKVALIPNGIGRVHKPSKTALALLAKRLGIRYRDFVVLYIGRMFDRQKNVSALIRAFTQTSEKRLRLLLVGDGPSLPLYAGLAGNDDRIIFAGPAKEDEIDAIYSISDLFVLPSVWEGFSLTLLEAAAHSLPMIISRNAYIDDLKTGAVGRIASFDPNNPAEIREKIIRMYKDAAMRRAAVKVSESINREFTEEKMIGKYRSLLKRLASGRMQSGSAPTKMPHLHKLRLSRNRQ